MYRPSRQTPSAVIPLQHIDHYGSIRVKERRKLVGKFGLGSAQSLSKVKTHTFLLLFMMTVWLVALYVLHLMSGVVEERELRWMDGV